MDAYIGEIRLWAANFAPVGWAFCDGKLLSIAGHEALFALLGTTYGGDGQVNFALPDLRGRVPVHLGPDHSIGERGGAETVTLTAANLPAHTHAVNAAVDDAYLSEPEGAVLATAQSIGIYASAAPTLSMHENAIGESIEPRSGLPVGTPNPQPHDNMQPFQSLNYIICLEGIFPPRS